MSEKFPQQEQPENHQVEPQEAPRWRISEASDVMDGSPEAESRKEEESALNAIDSELAVLDVRDPSKRHEREALRTRRMAIEAKRMVRQLTTFANPYDAETKTSLLEMRDLLNANLPASNETESGGNLRERIARLEKHLGLE
jgi:hypothetical protein